ncbi:MAG: CopD family protein [Pseudomonadota bacterium]
MVDVWTGLLALNTLGLYASALVSFGSVLIGFAFTRILRRPYYRDLTLMWSLLGLILSATDIAVRAAALTGAASGAKDPEMLKLVWGTPVGDAALWRVAGFALLLVGALLGRMGSWLALSGGVLVMCSFTLLGHVAEQEAFWLQLVLYFHLSAAAFWVGILGPLRRLALDRDKLDVAAQLGHGFGRAALFVLPVLVAAGAVMAWRLLDTWAAVATPYGLALLVKILAVAVLMGIGAANKTRHVPAMLRGEGGAADALANVIRKEQVVVALILTVTAALTVVIGAPV